MTPGTVLCDQNNDSNTMNADTDGSSNSKHENQPAMAKRLYL